VAKRICTAPDCDRPHLARGWCDRHYRIWRTSAADVPRCSEEDCHDPVRARGLCGMHWQRWRATGRTELRSSEELFWRHVQKGGPGGCWIWTACVDDAGYGQLSRNGVHLKAHRYAYMLLVGPIPEGMDVDHVKANGCITRACVKAIADEHGPAHLEPVTHPENRRRARKWLGLVCTAQDCGEAARVLGMCRRHYLKWHRSGRSA